MKIGLAVIVFSLTYLPEASTASGQSRAVGSSGKITTSGVIIGHAAANRTEVTEYLGIPYAASTNGSQRWMPPQRFNSTNTFNASAFVGPRSLALRHASIANISIELNRARTLFNMVLGY